MRPTFCSENPTRIGSNGEPWTAFPTYALHAWVWQHNADGRVIQSHGRL